MLLSEQAEHREQPGGRDIDAPAQAQNWQVTGRRGSIPGAAADTEQLTGLLDTEQRGKLGALRVQHRHCLSLSLPTIILEHVILFSASISGCLSYYSHQLVAL